MHQKLGRPGRKVGGRGEAGPKRCVMKHGRRDRGLEGSGRDDLLTQALASEHGECVETRQSQSRQCWGGWTDDRRDGGVPENALAGIREALRNGRYRPEPVRREQIRRPVAGCGLGIPDGDGSADVAMDRVVRIWREFGATRQQVREANRFLSAKAGHSVIGQDSTCRGIKLPHASAAVQWKCSSLWPWPWGQNYETDVVAWASRAGSADPCRAFRSAGPGTCRRRD